MAASRRTWSKVALLVALAAGAWKLWHLVFDADDGGGTKQLVNQLWLERMPRDERDLIYAAVLLEHKGERVGAVAHASRWRAHQDGFVWRLEGTELRTRFPQDDRRYTLEVRTWRCEGEAPRPFQLCLEARAGERVLRFYSMRDWVIRPRSDGDAALPREIAWAASLWRSAGAVAGGAEVGEGAESEGAGFLDRLP
jgi:hypothetical protein